MNQKFKKHIELIIKELDYPFIDVNIQTPKNIEHGDLTTNIAMIIAKKINENPIKIAEKIIEKINSYFGYEAIKEIKIKQKFVKRKIINKSIIKNYNNNELVKEILKTEIKDENLKKSVVNLGLSIKNTK